MLPSILFSIIVFLRPFYAADAFTDCVVFVTVNTTVTVDVSVISGVGVGVVICIDVRGCIVGGVFEDNINTMATQLIIPNATLTKTIIQMAAKIFLLYL